MRSRGSLLKRVSAVALALAFVGACGGDDDEASEGASATTATEATSQSPSTTQAPKRGGTLTYMYTFETRGFDPVMSAGFGGTAGDGPQHLAVFDSLVYEDQTTGEIIPGTAESVSSTDGLTWTIRLRPGIRFTDGTPYDAEAVRFNFARHADPANRSIAFTAASSIGAMSVVNPTTLSVTLKEPNSQFP